MDDTIDGYYAGGGEQGRLASGHGRLEMARTQEILRRRLPPPPVPILDVGGGPGVYAHWLARQGYEVHLVDPVPLHVEQARQRPLASAELGDARSLRHETDSADAVLLLGPLYHLAERVDRIQALREARRVARPGRPVFAVGISRYASLLDGFSKGFLAADPVFRGLVEQDLQTGQHRNPTGDPRYFTTAYFHRPEELAQEAEEAGLTVEDVIGIEGPGYWQEQDFDARWEDPEWREQLLWAARAVERERSLVGISAHIMVIARS